MRILGGKIKQTMNVKKDIRESERERVVVSMRKRQRDGEIVTQSEVGIGIASYPVSLAFSDSCLSSEA